MPMFFFLKMFQDKRRDFQDKSRLQDINNE